MRDRGRLSSTVRLLAAVLLLAAMASCGEGGSPPAGGAATPAATASTPAATTSSGAAPGHVEFQGSSTCPLDSNQPYQPSPPGTTGPPVGEATVEMPHAHVPAGTRVAYLQNPPTSGCHWSSTSPPAPLSPGVYGSEPAPEQWVHNLEHGYVVVLYRCPQGCTADVERLTQWARGLGPDPQGAVPYPKVLVVPYSAMPVAFACVSWDWYLGMDSLDITRVDAFYRNHAGHSPEGAAAG